MTMTPQQFPLLRSVSRSQDRFDSAIASIATGIEAGAIRNVTLKEAKETLSRAVSGAWERYVSDPHFFSGRYLGQPPETQALSNSILIMGLHDIIATSKKLAKTSAAGEAVDAMRSIATEALPLALAVASLKSKVVKGRAPSSAAALPLNPNKVVKTCPCCFRAIAVVSGTMAHHGYQRPGQGWQTASCPGIRFKPLEVSNEGLVWMVEQHKSALDNLKKSHADRDSIDSLQIKRERQIVKISRDDTFWHTAFRRYVAELESEIRQTESSLRLLSKQLEGWKPEP